MASKIGLSFKRETAIARFQAAAEAASVRLGLDLPTLPTGGRNAEAQAVAQLDAMAAILEAVTEAVAAQSPTNDAPVSAPPEPGPGAIGPDFPVTDPPTGTVTKSTKPLKGQV